MGLRECSSIGFDEILSGFYQGLIRVFVLWSFRVRLKFVCVGDLKRPLPDWAPSRALCGFEFRGPRDSKTPELRNIP